jgi:hypothetical protein
MSQFTPPVFLAFWSFESHRNTGKTYWGLFVQVRWELSDPPLESYCHIKLSQ